MTNENKTWYGDFLPEGWSVVPLKTLFSFGKGLPITKENLTEEGLNVISYGQVHSKTNTGTAISDDLIRHVEKSYAKTNPDAFVEPHGFIFADTSEDIGGVGNAVYVNGGISIYAGYHSVVLHPNDDTEWKYLAYLFRTDAWRSQIRKELTDVKVFSISQKVLKRTTVILPSKDDMLAISNFLDEKCASIDEAISRQKKVIEKLEEYKRSTIIYKVSHTDSAVEYVESNIPWMPTMPRTWDILPLKYAVSQRVNKNDGMQEKNLLTLSYGEIKRKDIETNEGLLPASFEGYNIIEQGDIVLRLLDLQNDTHSLRTGLVTERGVITAAYVTITPSSVFDPMYCRYLLHAYDLMKVLYTMGEGVRQSLSYDELSRKMLVPVPPMEEQRKIAEDISIMEANVNEAVDRMLKNIDKLEEYKRSLIHNAVTGKIDCR